MAMFFGALAFLGCVTCIIMMLVKVVKKQPVRSTFFSFVAWLAIFIACVSMAPTNSDSEGNVQEQVDVVVEYDALQKVFLAVNFETTEEDLLKIIEANDLKYVAQEYNGNPKEVMYKIAYEDDVALHKYADSGDYIKVSFSMEDGTMMVVDYHKSGECALLYNYGTYWDFNDDVKQGENSGYYYYTPGVNKGGSTIVYDNGRSKETGYHKVSSGEEAIRGVLSNID